MRILVYRNDKEGLICPKCGEKIKFDTQLIDKLSEFNHDINDTLEGLKSIIENIMNDIKNHKSINSIYNQLKNVNISPGNAISEIKKNKIEVNKLISINNTEIKNQNLNSKQFCRLGIITRKKFRWYWTFLSVLWIKWS